MKYIGIIMIVVGALILVLSYALGKFLSMGTVDNNWIQMLAVALILIGVPVHIYVTGRDSRA